MSLDVPPSGDLGLRPKVAVELPDVDDYTEGVTCPRCNRSLHAVGTPGVPVETIADDELVSRLLAGDVEHVPAFGWRCSKHRVTVVLPAPFAIAPESYEPVDATIEDRKTTLAVPEPFLANRGGAST